MNKVAVLLSTYNGAKFLDVQMASLLAQEGVEISIYVRDDGSLDNTPQMLENYSINYSNIKIIFGENLGVIGSFFTLLEQVDTGFDYYAFADQDDYWLPQKILRATTLLNEKNKNQPLLYCSALEYVDVNLQHLGQSNLNFVPSFGNALVENIVTGCTAVLNNALRELAIAYRPSKAVMHDWWLYLLANAFGRVIYEPHAYIKYRQHGANVIGATPSFKRLWQRRLKIVLQRQQIVSTLQAEEFYEHYQSKLSEKKCLLLMHFVKRKIDTNSRLYLIYSPEINKQKIIDTIGMKLLIAIGWY